MYEIKLGLFNTFTYSLITPCKYTDYKIPVGSWACYECEHCLSAHDGFLEGTIEVFCGTKTIF